MHVTVVVVVEMLEVVDGGVGSGAPVSNFSMEIVLNAVNGFGEHGLLVVPTVSPVAGTRRRSRADSTIRPALR